MSGLFGIFNRNGKPVSPEIVQKMLGAMSYWIPDDQGTWTNGPVAFGHTMLWNTPESKFEHLPSQIGHLTITMDVRLDNREELANQLRLTDRPLEQITDSTFIVEAYRKWGDDCPSHLLGDFAFAIWDEHEKRLFCARDHIGIKPFYYHCENDVFIFSNDIRGIVAHPDVPKELNELAILKYLYDIEDQTHAFFSAIRPLLPASTMVVTNRNVLSQVYWRLEDSPRIKFDTVGEYSELLRDLLKNAVQVRTRSLFPIASHLSGGLDSSAITVLAARCLRKYHKKLYTYNWVQSPGIDEDPEHYEWNLSRILAEMEQIHHEYVDLTAEKVAEFYAQQEIAFNDKQYLWYEQIVRTKATQAGVRTVLSGWGGDELISYNGRVINTGLFWTGSPIKALTRIFKESKTAKKPVKNFLGKCYRELILPPLPDKLYNRLTGMHQNEWDMLKCIKKSSYLRLTEIKIKDNHCSRMSARQQQVDLYNQGHLQNRIDSWSASAFKDRIEYRYPLLDKRIVEFALAVPSDLYRVDGYSRYLFRKTAADFLPAEICWGSAKSEPKRVELLYELMFEAQNLWKDALGNNNYAQNNKNMISLGRIFQYIDDTAKKWDLLDKNKKLERLLVIYRSIMAWQLGNN